MYGLDTMHVNTTDMARLEIKYRQVLKNMMSMPDYVSSPLVYLTTAQRDLEILGLLGQLAMCEDDYQNVRKIINNNLAFLDEKFGGWSGLVRTTAAQYGLPDPLQYMVNS